MPTSRKILAQYDDADFRDMTATGYRWTLYGDGRVTAEYHSRWQGSRDGARWTTEPGYVDLDDLDEDDGDNDALALLTSATETTRPAGDPAYRSTRRGHLVR